METCKYGSGADKRKPTAVKRKGVVYRAYKSLTVPFQRKCRHYFTFDIHTCPQAFQVCLIVFSGKFDPQRDTLLDFYEITCRVILRE